MSVDGFTSYEKDLIFGDPEIDFEKQLNLMLQEEKNRIKKIKEMRATEKVVFDMNDYRNMCNQAEKKADHYKNLGLDLKYNIWVKKATEYREKWKQLKQERQDARRQKREL